MTVLISIGSLRPLKGANSYIQSHRSTHISLMNSCTTHAQASMSKMSHKTSLLHKFELLSQWKMFEFLPGAISRLKKSRK